MAVRRSRVVIVICAELERQVREIAPQAAPVLIENAPGAGDVSRDGGRDAVRAEFGLGPTTPLVLYTGTFEAYQGLDLLFDAARTVHAARPDARFLLAGGRPDQIAAATREVAARGPGRDRDLCRRAAGRPDPALPRRRRRAGVAAKPRHEHAAQDLSVPAGGPGHRRHAAAHAHAGALRRGRDPHRADARGVWRPASSTPWPTLRALPTSAGAPANWPRASTATRRISAAPAKRSCV